MEREPMLFRSALTNHYRRAGTLRWARTSAVAALVAIAFIAPPACSADAGDDSHAGVRLGVEVGTAPFLAPAATFAAVADLGQSGAVHAAAALELWAKRGAGLRTTAGAAVPVVELAAGVKAEVAALTVRPGLSAFFSVGSNGFCAVPDLLPSVAVRAMW
jgi:hypothetical protein